MRQIWKRQKVVALGWWWELKVTEEGHEEYFWGDRNLLKLDCSDSYTIM